MDNLHEITSAQLESAFLYFYTSSAVCVCVCVIFYFCLGENYCE